MTNPIKGIIANRSKRNFAKEAKSTSEISEYQEKCKLGIKILKNGIIFRILNEKEMLFFI